jgi:hypothetical protein
MSALFRSVYVDGKLVEREEMSSALRAPADRASPASNAVKPLPHKGKVFAAPANDTLPRRFNFLDRRQKGGAL